jgi:murein DD-endopeptidase MepM/ murein hydrolase activator NlpD
MKEKIFQDVRIGLSGIVRVILGTGILLAAGCSTPSESLPSSTNTPVLLPTEDLVRPTIIIPSASPTMTPSKVLSLLPAPTPEPVVCSPLAGFVAADLKNTISNPFHPPARGSDDPHHGVDLADMDGRRVAQAGRIVQAVLPGRVAAVAADRFPYGNAVIIETTLVGQSWLPVIDLPASELLQEFNSPLTCPPDFASSLKDTEGLSIYLLYAHLQALPSLVLGEEISCGQSIGRIGDSGNALNPHLHLEARRGPESARFSSMAHYTASASIEEMANYCTWRISGYFQMFDPMLLFELEK